MLCRKALNIMRGWANIMAIKHKIRDRNGGTKEVSLTPLRSIRLQCIECMGFSEYEPKYCTSPLCSLYPYRLGSNPERKGLGGKGFTKETCFNARSKPQK